jgi:hypothetical protein
MQITKTPIDNLISYARTHSDAHVAQIAASITEFGWTNPILTDGNKGVMELLNTGDGINRRAFLLSKNVTGGPRPEFVTNRYANNTKGKPKRCQIIPSHAMNPNAKNTKTPAGDTACDKHKRIQCDDGSAIIRIADSDYAKQRKPHVIHYN